MSDDLSTITEFYEYTISDIQEISADIVALTVRVREMHDKIAGRLFALPVEPPWQRAEDILRHLDRENERRRNAAARRPPGQRPRTISEQPPAD